MNCQGQQQNHEPITAETGFIAEWLRPEPLLGQGDEAEVGK